MDVPEQLRPDVNNWISPSSIPIRERTQSSMPSPRASPDANRPRLLARFGRWIIRLLSFRLPSQRDTDALIRAARQKEYQRLRDPRVDLRFHD